MWRVEMSPSKELERVVNLERMVDAGCGEWGNGDVSQSVLRPERRWVWECLLVPTLLSALGMMARNASLWE